MPPCRSEYNFHYYQYGFFLSVEKLLLSQYFLMLKSIPHIYHCSTTKLTHLMFAVGPKYHPFPLPTMGSQVWPIFLGSGRKSDRQASRQPPADAAWG